MTGDAAPAWRSRLGAASDADPPASGASGAPPPDRRDGAIYLLDDDTRLAVDVALAAGRPLLLRGEPGSGKSSLAAFVARNLGWRYYEHVVTARTQARELLWTFDAVRKLADASARVEGKELRDSDYVEPGALWWALDRRSAARRGVPDDAGPVHLAEEPDADLNGSRSSQSAVVLLDEIDKADPDVPNGLLVPLGSTEFRVTETGATVRRPSERHDDDSPPVTLVIVTTNEERELPAAFLRRCVVHRLTPPRGARLIEIGRRHLAHTPTPALDTDDSLLAALAVKFDELRADATARNDRPPSTAEFLDAFHACRELGITVSHPSWKAVERLVLIKGPDRDIDQRLS